MIRVIVSAALGLALTLAACEQQADESAMVEQRPLALRGVAQTGQSVALMRDATAADRDDQVRRIERDLAELDRKLTDLDQKVRAAKPAVRQRLEPDLARVEFQRQAVNAKLDELRKDNGKIWHTIHAELRGEMQALKDACEGAARRLE